MLRAQLLENRKLLAHEVFIARNVLLHQRALALLSTFTARSLHVFLPIVQQHEPLTAPLYTWAWQQSWAVYVPRLTEDKQLTHVAFTPDTALTLDAWNIPTPLHASSVPVAALRRPIVVLVPLLGFDAQGFRLGYGKGYYDALLHAIGPDYVVGLSLAPPMERLPVVHEGDFRLQFCVTPWQTYIW